MATETLHMRIGENLGNILLDIAQDHILKGDFEKGITTYTDSLCGFTKEYALMCLKNQAVLTVDVKSQEVIFNDDKDLLKENASNIYDWNLILKNRLKELVDLCEKRNNIKKQFQRYYIGNIEDYDIIKMMLRYFSEDQLKNIGLHNIAARLIASPDTMLHNNQYSNPQSVWDKMSNKIDYEDPEDPNPNVSKWERILYYTVEYIKCIRLLHKDFIKFDKLYHWLIENELANRIPLIENKMEIVCDILYGFANTKTGYYHPLCNTDLYNYKTNLNLDLIHTTWGKEYFENGILKKDIMDGYDAGWLSPDGEFYASNGDISSLIHVNIAEQIFNTPTNKYAVKMNEDGVSIWGDTNSPEYWLEKNGWVKIHHRDCYGSFIGERDPEKRTKDFPYHYCPTEIQIKMICDYADKFYGGKFYTEANAFGRITHTEPFTTYKVRQMDEFKLHEIFGR